MKWYSVFVCVWGGGHYPQVLEATSDQPTNPKEGKFGVCSVCTNTTQE